MKSRIESRRHGNALELFTMLGDATDGSTTAVCVLLTNLLCDLTVLDQKLIVMLIRFMLVNYVRLLLIPSVEYSDFPHYRPPPVLYFHT